MSQLDENITLRHKLNLFLALLKDVVYVNANKHRVDVLSYFTA